ncbi:MAG: transglutaminase domain-containing protein, partial [Gemmatimonadota bacterium]
MRRAYLAGLLILVGSCVFVAGVLYGSRRETHRPSFHDVRVNHVGDLISLVDPDDPAVRSLARRLGTPEAAYAYVRNQVRYAPMSAAAPPGDIVRDRAASCLGKAALLCSLYRAMAIPADNVRVITGGVVLPHGLADHAWVDLEYGGMCLQQDVSGFLGDFGFAQFAGQAFSQAFV